MKINIEKELLDNHSDEEIIAYISKVLNGVIQNYQIALKANQPETLWSNLGDLSMVASILKNLKSRNDAREAAKEL